MFCSVVLSLLARNSDPGILMPFMRNLCGAWAETDSNIHSTCRMESFFVFFFCNPKYNCS